MIMDLIKLGKEQKAILKRMAKENLVIKSIFDYHRLKEEIFLQDKQGDNIYEQIHRKFLMSLVNRNILSITMESLSIQMDMTTFWISDDIKDLFFNNDLEINLKTN
jgi:hypothetical protein